MEIVFLGTGGGRINLIRQVRWTGGFRINSSSANIHVDPGPGALVRSHSLKQNPLELDCVIVTHAHIDHSNDANLMVEAMSSYALKRKGIIIGSRAVLEGVDGERMITGYHQAHAEESYIARYGERKKFRTKKGGFELEVIEARHDENTCFGFKLWLDGIVIGHTSDTEYYDRLGKRLAGCDILIANCLKPEADGIPDHLETKDVVRLLLDAKPKLCIITHMGLKMLRAGPGREAAKIERLSGIWTIAVKDGQGIFPQDTRVKTRQQCLTSEKI